MCKSSIRGEPWHSNIRFLLFFKRLIAHPASPIQKNILGNRQMEYDHFECIPPPPSEASSDITKTWVDSGKILSSKIRYMITNHPKTFVFLWKNGIMSSPLSTLTTSEKLHGYEFKVNKRVNSDSMWGFVW